MSVARAREVRDRLRALGFVVHEWPGWESRGNGQSSAYEGAIWHHTGSAYGSAYRGLVDGRPDLSGPLCNFAGNADGSFTLIAAHPANHAGASGGRNTAPLPRTRTFNRCVMGLEIVYPGDKPMTDAQYRAMLAWGKVTTDVFGFSDINRVKGHAETSITGKWDPGFAPGKTIDLNKARADARAGKGGDDMFEDGDRNALKSIKDNLYYGGGDRSRLDDLLDLVKSIHEMVSSDHQNLYHGGGDRSRLDDLIDDVKAIKSGKVK
ncbi:peptidoglycan recognition protein family protein [Amycolatopsis anabasis]|uniref:peptidoglycan recognition protein family protein n=1 Tax=Amycolatopsis anabasis TaxID=1840409 RepID=UPI00131E25B0|nr:N-acetylmuramoyl-L-alanine amidase [Amycolatopsis anabasis]